MKMKTTSKILLMIALSIVLFQATLTLSFAQEPGATAAREESTILENIYQERVRGILNNLVAPEDYTLVISATMKNDEKKFKEYSENVERKFLPGLPIHDPTAFTDANNLLLEMKQKVEIQVILTENVPSDRDGIVRDILKTKLHLNEETGDAISVVRAARIVPFPKAGESRKLPELSAKMIAFWILVGLMALTGVLLWLQRRKEKAQEEERQKQEFLIEQRRALDAALDEKEKESPEEQEPVVAPVTELTEEQKNEFEMKLAFEKSEITKLCMEYGSIIARAVEEFVTQGHVVETVIVMEALGWGESKKLFRDIEPRFWSKIGNTLRSRIAEPSLQEVYAAAHYFHRFGLSFVLERTAKEDGNPFNFVFKLNEHQRLDLLNRESPDKIALVGVYCTGTQMTDLLAGLDSGKQNEILYHLTRIKQLPEKDIKASVVSYLSSLERIKRDPSVFADGPVLAAEFLRSLPAGREEELVGYLFTNHPAEAEQIRRVRVMFQDIPYYPQEMTKKVIEDLDTDLLQRALSGYDPAFLDSFLALLPTKKAMMIQNDLLHMESAPPVSQCAENRREICGKLEVVFENQRFNLADFWKEREAQAGYRDFTDEDTNSYEQEQSIHDLSPDGDDQNDAA